MEKYHFLFIFLLGNLANASNLDCSLRKIEEINTILKGERDNTSSIKFKTYGEIENAMLCDFEGKLDDKKKKIIINNLKRVRDEKPTPFVWATRNGANLWKDGVAKLNFFPEKIRDSLPIILSQLNSAVVAFVPSENKDNSTKYEFSADLDIDLFSPWDRRGCSQIPKDEIEYIKKSLEKERVSKEGRSNFTRNYAGIEVSKISIKKKPLCHWLIKTKEIVCEDKLEGSIVHEILHFLNTRFPKMTEKFLHAKGGYYDRLKVAQQVVPNFGITKCTPQVWEEHCSEGPITNEEAALIANKVNLPQGYGSVAGKYFAFEIKYKSQKKCFNQAVLVKSDGKRYCVDKNNSDLYALVRGGEEYLQILLEKAILDKEQFEKVASEEEKRLFSTLNDYLF